MSLTCLKCGSRFPLSITIDGKKRNLSKRKFCLNCSPFGSLNRKDLTLPQPPPGFRQCGRCHEVLPISQFYPRKGRNDTLPYCASCEQKRAFLQARKFKQMCLDYKGAYCSRCGYDRCPGALDFHHLDASQKELQINKVRSMDFERVKAELDKCIVLCANCHREEHYYE
ncbi:MAG: hypothetical protein JO250_11725 [Armatimonadetes bacterium]|nr:hypothetical protein [Armatimonadota bacterium]